MLQRARLTEITRRQQQPGHVPVAAKARVCFDVRHGAVATCERTNTDLRYIESIAAAAWRVITQRADMIHKSANCVHAIAPDASLPFHLHRSRRSWGVKFLAGEGNEEPEEYPARLHRT